MKHVGGAALIKCRLVPAQRDVKMLDGLGGYSIHLVIPHLAHVKTGTTTSQSRQTVEKSDDAVW